MHNKKYFLNKSITPLRAVMSILLIFAMVFSIRPVNAIDTSKVVIETKQDVNLIAYDISAIYQDKEMSLEDIYKEIELKGLPKNVDSMPISKVENLESDKIFFIKDKLQNVQPIVLKTDTENVKILAKDKIPEEKVVDFKPTGIETDFYDDILSLFLLK